MIQPKAVIFDYGNVLCQPQRLSDQEAMARIIGVPVVDFGRLYWQRRGSYDSHELDASSYWRWIAEQAGCAISQEQLQEFVRLDSESWARPCPTATSWVARLKESGFRTAILSNMPLAIRQYLESQCSWFPEFDHHTFSCDVGCIKPDRRIYDHSLEGLSLQPDEVLFLDDRSENIEAAENLGMHCLLFTTIEEAAAIVASKYLLPKVLS